MEFGVGSILEGKVTGLTKFGAFVSLPEGKSGLVHISEIAYSYVNDVKDYLKEGQEVKVKVIGIDENGRINLSIKKAMDPPPRPAGQGRPMGGARPAGGGRPGGFSRGPAAPREPASFEDKLKHFLSTSEGKMADRPRTASSPSSITRRSGAATAAAAGNKRSASAQPVEPGGSAGCFFRSSAKKERPVTGVQGARENGMSSLAGIEMDCILDELQA